MTTTTRLGIASPDWNGYMDDAGRILDPGNTGFVFSVVTGRGYVWPPYDFLCFRWLTSDNMPYYGPEVWC